MIFLPSLFVGMILNNPDGTVGLVQAVLSLHIMTMTVLVMVLMIVGMRVLYFIGILVLGFSLKKMVLY